MLSKEEEKLFQDLTASLRKSNIKWDCTFTKVDEKFW